jgi:hypothetical protein
MTIEDLEELRYLNSEISAVQREIESMYNTYGSPAFEKIGQSPISPGDPTADAVRKIIGLQAKYNSMLNDMADRRDRVNAWLVSLDDGEIKSIIRWHYLCGKSWKQTSGLVYGGRSNERNAYRVIRRYFGKDK